MSHSVGGNPSLMPPRRPDVVDALAKPTRIEKALVILLAPKLNNELKPGINQMFVMSWCAFRPRMAEL
ncbi:hypothetical protein BDV26DRAFT_292720 [Aspergillus bertholletiae]|uniref:Uncharacterized protein n=1 Tax=Aspergillus bertholletiae TaxID=1226010 RepID=A0A5N7B8C7_9EURO|nr:hypothetical protein BDV26DRAFT_292720 [Aspergillus bertholletiae]